MDVKAYIPEKLRDLVLWDKMGDVLQKIVDDREAEFADFIFKYTDIPNLSVEALDASLRELGYGYILDILDLSKFSLQNIIVLGSLIHILKGSREGLEVVLKLLNISYSLEEWWENPDQNNTPVTFRFLIDLDITNVKSDTYTKLKEFLSNYVYPVARIESISSALLQVSFLGAGFYDRLYEGSSIHPAGFIAGGVSQETYVSTPIG